MASWLDSQELSAGSPYLVQRGLHELAAHGTQLEEFERKSRNDDWIFGEHLRRVSGLVCGDEELGKALRTVLAGRPGITSSAFYRLRSAGILSGESVSEARARCPLYASYLLPILTPRAH
jgi:hypothetical protein